MAQAFLLHGAKQLLTLRGPRGVRRGSGLRDLGIIEDGSVLVKDGVVAAVGSARRLENLKDARSALEIPVHGRVLMPGFVDPNLSLDLRSPHRPGKLKKVSEFYDDSLSLLRACLQNGTLTAETKATARAFDFHSDISLFRKLAYIGSNPVRSVHTWHIQACQIGDAGSPSDFGETFATLRRRHLINAVEVSAGEHMPLQTELVDVAEEAEVEVKLRWEGGTAQALSSAVQRARPKTITVGCITPDESKVLAMSTPITIFSTGAGVFEGPSNTSARSLLDDGGAIALSSGYESSSAATFSMQMAVALGVVRLGLTPEEALSAATINAAYAVGLGNSVGSLEVGKRADLLVLDASDYREIPRQFGINHVIIAMRDGNIVLNRSRWKAAS